jgi:hypothetical protein
MRRCLWTPRSLVRGSLGRLPRTRRRRLVVVDVASETVYLWWLWLGGGVCEVCVVEEFRLMLWGASGVLGARVRCHGVSLLQRCCSISETVLGAWDARGV